MHAGHLNSEVWMRGLRRSLQKITFKQQSVMIHTYMNNERYSLFQLGVVGTRLRTARFIFSQWGN